MTHAEFPHVFRPLTLNGLSLRNRIFVPAHTTNLGEDNRPSDAHVEYHRARARGGAAMIIFEGIRVHESSLGRRQGVNGYERDAIPAFAKVARAVQAEGAKLFGQIIHLGRHIDGNYTRTPAWGASAIPWTPTAPPPHPMTEEEIAMVVAAHAAVARNLLEAGLDGIELTMSHGHLLQQFLSPISNARTDRYGGEEANRLRFAAETLAAVRAAIGPDVVLGLRISADEFIEGGLTLADMCRIVPRLLAQTPVDFVNVSHSAYHGSASLSTQMADMAFAQDHFHYLSRGIAAVSSAPVFSVCRYRTVAEANAMLADPAIAMVGMARAHIADPDLVEKARGGRAREQRQCVGCNQGCAGFLALNLAITCLVNPAMGREREWPEPEHDRAPAPKRVLVVGGGPAGLEAAQIAARRGHRVTLWEAEALGGRINWLKAMPHRHDFLTLIRDQERRAREVGVEIVVGRRADAEAIVALGADAVILATGAEPRGMEFPGGGHGLTLEVALAEPEALGARVAVVDTLGSWAIGAVVEHLARIGKAVTVLCPTGTPGWQITPYSYFAWRQRLKDRGVRLVGLVGVHGHEPGRTTLVDAGGQQSVAAFDSVIAPAHGRPRDALAAELRARGIHPRLVGDCQSPRTALEAVFEGHQAARAL